MNPAIFAYAVQVLTALPDLIEAGVAVHDLVVHTNEKIARMQAENRAPNDEEWNELNTRIAAKRTELHAVTP